MTTLVGSGQSGDVDTHLAAGKATTKALVALQSKTPTYGFVFSGPDHDLKVVMRSVKGHCGAVPLVGCSTAGEFTEMGLSHGGVVVMLVHDSATTAATSCAINVADAPDRGAKDLADSTRSFLQGVDKRRFPYANAVILIDGLAGVGESIVGRVNEEIGMSGQMVGGAAGDEGRFQTTHVATDMAVAQHGAAMLHTATERPWGVGVGHGLTPATDKMRVTRAAGNVLYEIEDRPAIEAYREFAKGRGVELTPKNQAAFMIAHELGVYVFDAFRRARAPIGVGSDGSLSLAASIPTGAKICILDGEPSKLLVAARTAAEEAKQRLNGADAAGVVVFDCLGVATAPTP